MGIEIKLECASLQISVNDEFFSAHDGEERKVLLHPCMILTSSMRSCL